MPLNFINFETILTGGIGTLVGTILTAWFNYRARVKEISAQSVIEEDRSRRRAALDQHTMLVAEYKEMVAVLQASLAQFRQDLRLAEAEHMEIREENATLRGQLAAYRLTITKLDNKSPVNEIAPVNHEPLTLLDPTHDGQDLTEGSAVVDQPKTEEV